MSSYVQVTSADQNLVPQLKSIHEYAQDQLEMELDENRTFRDKSTGTNTERSVYRELMKDVEAGLCEHDD